MVNAVQGQLTVTGCISPSVNLFQLMISYGCQMKNINWKMIWGLAEVNVEF